MYTIFLIQLIISLSTIKKSSLDLPYSLFLLKDVYEYSCTIGYLAPNGSTNLHPCCQLFISHEFSIFGITPPFTFSKFSIPCLLSRTVLKSPPIIICSSTSSNLVLISLKNSLSFLFGPYIAPNNNFFPLIFTFRNKNISVSGSDADPE